MPVKTLVAVVAIAGLYLAAPIAAAQPRIDTSALSGVLFSYEDQVDRRRIGWFLNDLEGAYTEALNEQLPLVLIFSDRNCGHCLNLLTDALVCRQFNAMAGQAVFAYSDVKADPAAAGLFDRLEVSAYPATSILAPNRDQIEELFRIVGYWNLAEYLGHLGKVDGLTVIPESDARAGLQYPLIKSAHRFACAE